jgi:hypothetical protein
MSKLSSELCGVTRVGLDLAKHVFQIHARPSMFRICSCFSCHSLLWPRLGLAQSREGVGSFKL